MCGHMFCNRCVLVSIRSDAATGAGYADDMDIVCSCILKELEVNMQCPVCKKVMLLRLHVESD